MRPSPCGRRPRQEARRGNAKRETERRRETGKPKRERENKKKTDHCGEEEHVRGKASPPEAAEHSRRAQALKRARAGGSQGREETASQRTDGKKEEGEGRTDLTPCPC